MGVGEERLGIRAAARAEVERRARLRQDAQATVEILTALVAELNEADVATRLVPEAQAYGDAGIRYVLRIRPIHPVEGKGVPAWPDTGLEAVAYEVLIDPTHGFVEFQGPMTILPDGKVEPLEDYEDPAYVERFKTQGDAGLPHLSAFVDRVRELAIMREVSLQSAASPIAR